MIKTNAPAKLQHYFGGVWKASKASEYANVVNPATLEVLSTVPMASDDDVEAVVQSAAAAFPGWRRTPPEDRIQYPRTTRFESKPIRKPQAYSLVNLLLRTVHF